MRVGRFTYSTFACDDILLLALATYLPKELTQGINNLWRNYHVNLVDLEHSRWIFHGEGPEIRGHVD